MLGEENESGGGFAPLDELIAQYQTTRIRAFWTYKRIFQLSKTAILTVDPLKFSVTNTFPYGEIQNLSVDDKIDEQFSFVWNNSIFTYSCDYRCHLLCQLYECMAKYSAAKFKSYGPFSTVRLRKNGNEQPCKLSVEPFGLIERNSHLEVIQEYKWYNIGKIGYDESAFFFYFEYSGRIKGFLSPDYNQILNACRHQLRLIGLEKLPISSTMKLSLVIESRSIAYNSIPVGVSSFEVNKWTRRSSRPVAKQLHLSEEYLLETDSAGFYSSSFRKISSIYALVRSWRSAREFKIEFDDETSATYTSTMRDTLLAMLLDVCRARGNVRVVVTGEVSDGLRVMPRFALESYQASLKDAFFGAGSVEGWYLSRLSRLCKQHLETSVIVDACGEFNANVQCPGISTTADQTIVKTCLIGILIIIQNEVIKSIHGTDLSNARLIVVLLQSIFRIIPSVHGYKGFVEVKEVDTRKLLFHLLRYDDDFVNYWTLEVLMALCRCPLLPRNMQQEFVNKHTLLSEETLRSLFDLISSRIYKTDTEVDNSQTVRSSQNAEILGDVVGAIVEEAENKILSYDMDTVAFVPNSLVVISSASLLESLVCSRKDTTSPELFQQILDMIMERRDMLITMLRSNSFLIMENAAILMFILMKHRPTVAKYLKEAALCEALVLKHLYNAVFSSSSSQRFISRFLVAAWGSGSPKTNPVKDLLLRILPPALLEFLRYEPIAEDHRKALDEIEEDFYNRSTGQVNSSSRAAPESNVVGDIMHQRMTNRISGIVSDSASTQQQKNNKLPENYRIFFHMITRDHKLPDLIWNEQTRLELRSALLHEIKEYEREQRLQGSKKIAWNYQQFEVRYETLQDEMKVGAVYVRYFLDSGDAFLRSLQNPSPQMLFEKLFRRILVNVESNTSMAILCSKCLCRLYTVCRDLIGSFDDMIILVKMLQKATNLELQQYLLDLLLILSDDSVNLSQLLDKQFVDVMVQYVSLAHLNPLQIGNLLARSTSQYLLLQGSTDTASSETSTQFQASTSSGPVDNRSLSVKSLWIPFDENCPRVWFVAPPTVLPPPRQTQKGPFRVSELISQLELKSFSADWVAAALSSDEADDESFQSIVDTGRWRTLQDIFQLRMQLFFPGQPIYTPAQVSYKGLQLLQKISSIHRSANAQGVPFFPIPLSKRIMSEFHHINIFAQLLLSNDPIVVDASIELIKALVELNSLVNAKLYLSGVFFFACRYSGNNFRAISHFFASTHLQQGFHDSANAVAQDLPLQVKSILGSMFPPAMVSILHNYGPERFATVHSGDFDTPEVIWNQQLRQHLIEMIDQHLGDFPSRLKQFTLAEYEYCPIPRIRYPLLDKEIYVHEYYLRNLCDEIRFKDWPIADPLALLKECLERWRGEMSKSAVDSAIEEALAILQLPKKFSNIELRKAYKNLARIHHPDKNPGGRDFFEKIHSSYELLSSYELQEHERNYSNIILLVKTQVLIYRRFADFVADQKYPCYELASEIIEVPDENTPLPLQSVTSDQNHVFDGPSATNRQAELLIASTNLLQCTTFVSTLNARELTKVSGALVKLHKLLLYAFGFSCGHVIDSSSTSPVEGSLHIYDTIVSNVVKTFVAVASTSEGRNEIHSQLVLQSQFIIDICNILAFYQAIPFIAETVIELLSRCCSTQALQIEISRSGIIWKLVPLLLNFDPTSPDTITESTAPGIQRQPFDQRASNALAIASAKLLSRLGGYLFDDLKTENNPLIKDVLSKLLTPSIAILLRNRQAKELLIALNENVENTTKIWNVGMRKELLAYLEVVLKRREPGIHEKDLLQVKDEFVFSNLKEELMIGNVYVRVFNQTKKTEDIENVTLFCHQMIEYIGFTIVHNYYTSLHFDFLSEKESLTPAGKEDSMMSVSMTDISWRFKTTIELTLLEATRLDSILEAMRNLLEMVEYSIYDLLKHRHGVQLLFKVLDLVSVDSVGFLALSKIFVQVCNNNDFIVASVGCKPPVIWRFLNTLCLEYHEEGGRNSNYQSSSRSGAINNFWTAAEAFAANAEGLMSLLKCGLVVRLLGILLAVDGYNQAYNNRVSAISLLTKCLWNPIHGSTSSTMLRRFLPEPLVILLKQSIGKASIQILDTVSENPELIWTEDMQTQLRQGILAIHEECNLSSTKLAMSFIDHSLERTEQICEFISSVYGFRDQFDLSNSAICIKYTRLEQEIFVGNVYIRLFLKQPTYKLKNPVYFLEKLIEQFDHCFSLQVPRVNEGVAKMNLSSTMNGDGSNSMEIVVGKEDFLSLLISCVICCLKTEHTLVEEILKWGFLDTCIHDYFYRINYFSRFGTPLLSILRFLNECSNFMEFNDHLIAYTASISSKTALSSFQNQRTRNHEFHKINNIIFDLAFALIDESSIPVDLGVDENWSELVICPLIKLRKDSIITIELFRKIFACYHHEQILVLLHYSLVCSLPGLLVHQVINKSVHELSYLTNASAVKFFTIDLIKSMLSIANDRMTIELQQILSQSNAWGEFRDQQHDLYVTSKERVDVYLIEDASDKKFSGLLMNGPRNTLSSECSTDFNSASQQPLRQGKGENRFEAYLKSLSKIPLSNDLPVNNALQRSALAKQNNVNVSQSEPKKVEASQSGKIPPINTGELSKSNDTLPVQQNNVSDSTAEDSMHIIDLEVPKTEPTQNDGRTSSVTTNNPPEFTTCIKKGIHGLGLDLAKSSDGRAYVLKLKEFADIVNPASVCSPPVRAGDYILAVNGKRSNNFMEIVSMIRSSPTSVNLTLFRLES